MRRNLDALYDAAGYLAAFFFVGLLFMVLLTIVAVALIYYFPGLVTWLPSRM